MKKINLMLVFALTLNTYLACYITNPYLINIFVKNLPEFDKNGTLIQSKNQQAVEGIPFLYLGYIGYSENGRLSFPRRHKNASFNLLITTQIAPVFMQENMVHHLEIDKNALSNIYTIEQKEDNESGLYYWDVKKSEIEKTGKISLNTIIMLTNPNKVYIPTGATITSESMQLILPDIYVKKDIFTIPFILWTPDIKQFFSLTTKTYRRIKTDQESGYSILTTNS